MPVYYQFRCATCAHRMEERRPMGDTEGVKCPKCGKRMVVVIRPINRIWKGAKP